MYSWHALPEGWEKMDYQSFLKKRRELMAAVIRDAYSIVIMVGSDRHVVEVAQGPAGS